MNQTRLNFIKNLFLGGGAAAVAVASPGTIVAVDQPKLIAELMHGIKILSMKSDGKRLHTRLQLPSGIETSFFSVATGNVGRDAEIFVIQLERNMTLVGNWMSENKVNIKPYSGPIQGSSLQEHSL